MTKENKHRRFQQKKDPKFKALKEHVLGSPQRRNLAHTSRRERTFSIGRNYLASLIKIKLLGENLRERVKARGICSNKRLL